MVATRNVECPTNAATLTAGRAASTAATYAAIVGYTYLSGPPSRFKGGGTFACTSGARLIPQLPTMTVVTPWLIFGSMCGSERTIWSSWVCTSMNPGATILPLASSTSAPPCARSAPTSTMRSPWMRTSAAKRGAPVPSMTVPPRRSRTDDCVPIPDGMATSLDQK